MNKSNIYNWIKKLKEVWISGITNLENYELDELYWFIEQKPKKETRENIYLITMISQDPRQTVGFSVATDRCCASSKKN